MGFNIPDMNVTTNQIRNLIGDRPYLSHYEFWTGGKGVGWKYSAPAWQWQLSSSPDPFDAVELEIHQGSLPGEFVDIKKAYRLQSWEVRYSCLFVDELFGNVTETKLVADSCHTFRASLCMWKDDHRV